MFELFERQIISFARLRGVGVNFRRHSSSSVLWKKGSVVCSYNLSFLSFLVDGQYVG
jgi:hypothetical protein